MIPRLFAVCVLALLGLSSSRAAEPGLVFEGGAGVGQGKSIVLVCGDEEYRSEEALPQLAKILAKYHGFRCTVLFPIDLKDGTINPVEVKNIPGMDQLRSADLLVLFTRFRDLPDEQMKPFLEYLESGKPIVGLRTATHAFNFKTHPTHAEYSYNHKGPKWEGGFGRQVLGETWINHHGSHGKESTRGIVAPGAANHPILRGIRDGDVWGPTDVYTVRLPLPAGRSPILMGQVLTGMQPTDPPVAGKKNDPMMPIAWTGSYSPASGKSARVFTTTMGSSQDLENEGFRRLLVNACYWALGLEDKIPERSKVDLVGKYQARKFGFGLFTKGLKPADLKD